MTKPKYLPTTKEGWLQLEYTMVGVMVTLVCGFMLLVGMKIGYNYGASIC